MFYKAINYFKNLVQKKQFHWIVFILTLVAFIYNSLQYCFLDDDLYFLESTANKSIAQSFTFFYYNLNGRWFSNLLNAIIFTLLGNNPIHYWPVHLVQFLLFILSVSYFLKSIFSYFYTKDQTLRYFLTYGAFFTSIFYWFFFDARIEVWYWESSCTVHLVALLIIFTVYGIVYEKNISITTKYIWIIFLCTLMGNGSETFSVACVLISTYLVFLNRKQPAVLYLHLTVAFFTGISLLSNVLAESTSLRKNNLLDSTLLNGIKFGFYTIYIQLQKVKHIPFKMASLALLVGLSSIIIQDLQLKKPIINELLPSAKFCLGLIVAESLFFPAYSITQETPDRALSFLYLLFLLLVTNYCIKKITSLQDFQKVK